MEMNDRQYDSSCEWWVGLYMPRCRCVYSINITLWLVKHRVVAQTIHLPCSTTTHDRHGSLASAVLASHNSGTSSIFTARRNYARAVLGVVILSVCLSHACFVTKPNNALRIFWYHTKALVFWYQHWLSADMTPNSVWNLRSKWPTSLRKTPTSTDFRI